MESEVQVLRETCINKGECKTDVCTPHDCKSYELFVEVNLPEKWNHAHSILRAANATISSRYKGERYTSTYRQKKK